MSSKRSPALAGRSAETAQRKIFCWALRSKAKQYWSLPHSIEWSREA